jgi:hypothetical protein
MVINIEFDTVYEEFENHSSISGELEEITNSSNRTVFIDMKPTAADKSISFDLKIEEDKMKGSWYYSALRSRN